MAADQRIYSSNYWAAKLLGHYNYFRDYDPRIGRYVESDPVGLRAGINTYGYVAANPLIFVDSRGLKGSDGGGVFDWFKKRFEPDPIGEGIGEGFGNNCALFCTELKNPRRDRADVASEICYRIIPPPLLATETGGAIFLSCRETCLARSEEICDRKVGFCSGAQ